MDIFKCSYAFIADGNNSGVGACRLKVRKIIDELEKFLFLLPALGIFSFVIIIPIISGIGIALTNWNGLSSSYDFVGLKNLRILLTDPGLLGPLGNTLFFTCMVTVFVNLIGLVMALGFNNKFKGSELLKSLFFMPIATSLVLASFLWTNIYIDVFPKLFGMSGLLGNPRTVMSGIVLICIWRDSGLAMVIYYANLQVIPKETLEAAIIDGCNFTKKLRFIILPLLAPAFTTCVTLWIGWGLKIFDYPFVSTNGGPGKASWTLGIYVYNYAFPYNKAGYGQMAAIVMTVLVVAITGIVTKVLRRREVEY